MSTYAISSFIDGFFKGRDWRDGKEQAKYERERQKKLDEIQFNQDRRAQEDFNYTQSERARARDKQDRMQGALDEALAATQGSMPAMGAQQPGVAISTQNGTAAPAAGLGAMPAALPVITAPAPQAVPFVPPARAAQALPAVTPPAAQAVPFVAPPAAPPASGAPASMPAPAPSGQIVPNMPMPQNPVMQTTGPGPTGVIDPALYEMGALPRRFQQDPMAAPPAAPQAAGSRDLDAMARDAAAQALAAGQPNPNPNHQFFQSGGLVSDVGELGQRARAAAPQIAAATANAALWANDRLNPAERMKDVAISAANPVLDYAFGVRIPPDQPAATPATPATAPTPAVPSAPANSAAPQQLGPLKSNLPANATPQQQQAVNAASAAVNPAAPSASILAATAPQGMGAAPSASTKGKPLPADMDARKERATTSFMERYMEVGAPIVMEEMLRQGNIEGAMKFQEWIDTASTQKAMKAYAGFMFAASMGDHEGALDAYTEMFNNNDYLANGLEIVRESSDFTKDAAGNVTGAVMTFKDEKGNLYEQVFDDIGDMYELGAMFGSPENGFKLAEEKAKAQSEQAMGVAKDAKAAADERAKFIRDTAPDLMKGDPLSGRPPLTPEEAAAAAASIYEAAQGQAAQTSLGSLPADMSGQQPVIAFRP